MGAWRRKIILLLGSQWYHAQRVRYTLDRRALTAMAHADDAGMHLQHAQVRCSVAVRA